MKLSSWVAVLGCVGLGVGAAVSAQGCTATATVGPCDGQCYGGEDSGSSSTDQDSGTPATNEDSGTVATNDSGTSDAATGTDGGETCNACLYGQCVSQYANCAADQTAVTGCLAIYQCATSAACMADGGNCVQDCFNAGSAAGQAEYLALGDCDQNAQCAGTGTPGGACGTTCGSTAASCPASPVEDAGEDAAAVADAGACSACQTTSCSTELAACQPGTACATYNQCLIGCTSQACDTACASTDDAGASAATALGTCTATNCLAPCSQ